MNFVLPSLQNFCDQFRPTSNSARYCLGNSFLSCLSFMHSCLYSWVEWNTTLVFSFKRYGEQNRREYFKILSSFHSAILGTYEYELFLKEYFQFADDFAVIDDHCPRYFLWVLLHREFNINCLLLPVENLFHNQSYILRRGKGHRSTSLQDI